MWRCERHSGHRILLLSPAVQMGVKRSAMAILLSGDFAIVSLYSPLVASNGQPATEPGRCFCWRPWLRAGPQQVHATATGLTCCITGAPSQASPCSLPPRTSSRSTLLRAPGRPAGGRPSHISRALGRAYMGAGQRYTTRTAARVAHTHTPLDVSCPSCCSHMEPLNACNAKGLTGMWHSYQWLPSLSIPNTYPCGRAPS